MNIEIYSTKLRNLKLIPTIQRMVVLEFLEKNRIHPTAEEIFHGVKDRSPSLTKATVYNVLDALKKVKAIQELTIDREVARYDYNADPHLHFLCRSCGNLYDVDLSCSIRPGDVILGHRVEAAQIYLYGVCAQCVNGNGQDNNESKQNTEGRDNA
ncbi:transcriptional repressor [Candidatus Bipolaricaulota bacterium]|nr:transcriptional repressor [Candidatus Bipolaricaulota bacterium]